MNIDEVFEAFDKEKDEFGDNLWSYDSRESVENFIKFYKENNKTIKLVEYTGAKPTCQCGKDGVLRLMNLEDKKHASKHCYIACDGCFKTVWAGEN